MRTLLALALALLASVLSGCGGSKTNPDSRVDGKLVTDGKTSDGKGADGKLADGRGADGKATDARPGEARSGEAGAKTPCGTLQCTTSTEICVVDEAETKTYACKAVPAGCDAQRTCACVGKALCTTIFNLCMDTGGANTITCECPNC